MTVAPSRSAVVTSASMGATTSSPPGTWRLPAGSAKSFWTSTTTSAVRGSKRCIPAILGSPHADVRGAPRAGGWDRLPSHRVPGGPVTQVEHARSRHEAEVWAMFVGLTLAWGASFLFIKIGLNEGLEPFTLVAWRMTLAVLFLT